MLNRPNKILCQIHKEPAKYYCNNCLQIICEKCEENELHNNHEIISLKQGVLIIRKKIDQAISNQILSNEVLCNYILKLKTRKLSLLKSREITEDKLKNTIHSIIDTLLLRKKNLIDEINQKFDESQNILKKAENNWRQKEKIIYEINKLYEQKNKNNLFLYTKFIMGGIKLLDQKITRKKLEIFNNLSECIFLEYPLNNVTNKINDNKYNKKEDDNEKNLTIFGKSDEKNNTKIKIFNKEDLIISFTGNFIIGNKGWLSIEYE